MVELTQADLATIVKTAKLLDNAVSRLNRFEESFDLVADAGDNTYGASVVKPDRILVVTHMWGYDATNAPTYIRMGFHNRTRNVWVKIEPAPLVLETVNFYGDLYLYEGMYPVWQGNGITANDDLHGGFMGYWVRAPRIS